MSFRAVKSESRAQPTMEGAGVHLHRVLGFGDPGESAPFLLLDDFRNDRPDDYLAGFPWHPHRGIETITYVLAGEVEHGDSLGNRGTLGAGDVQWMTAARGIVHSAMPQQSEGRMRGFQLWLNLPAKEKMKPAAYSDIPAAQIPVVQVDQGSVKVIAGRFNGTNGAVHGGSTDTHYWDVHLEPGAAWEGVLTTNSVPVSASRDPYSLQNYDKAVEHGEIIEAVAHRDLARAQALMLEHLQHIERSLTLEPGTGEVDLEAIFRG